MLEFLEDYVEEHDYSSTIQEIQKSCGFGGYRSGWEKVSALKRKGFIETEVYKERGIRLT
mgnify:CR=1 FL=1